VSLYYWFRCRIGRPVCYRDYPPGVTDWWFAMCKSCHRQSEMHRG
jgi:hypothetical protein